MPQYLVGAAQTYTTIQAAYDAIIALGDLSGTGTHEVIVDAGFVHNGAAPNPAGMQTASDGNIVIRSAGLYTLQLSSTFNLAGNMTLQNFIADANSGFSGTELISDNSTDGNVVQLFRVSNSNSQNVYGVYSSASWRNNDCFDGVAFGFNVNPWLEGVGGFRNVARVTVADCGVGIDRCLTVIDSAVIGSTGDDFGGSNTTVSYSASSDATASGTGSITNIVAATEFVDAANDDFTLAGGSQLIGAGSTGNNIGWYQPAAVNNDPVLDTPISDISVPTNTSGTIADISGNFSDADSDTLTYSVTPALPSGMTLNTTTGVISGNGSITVTAAANYTFSADDGNGGTPASDVVSITVTAPAFSVDSVSGGDQPGESWVFALSNASGSGMTANIGGVDLPSTAQDSGSYEAVIPDLLTFAGGIYRFSENLTVEIVDGASSATINVPVAPADGYTQFAVPDPIAGVWASSEFTTAISPQVLAIGDYIWCTNPADSDAPNGSFPESSSIDYRIMDMSDGTPAWGSEGTITISPSFATVDTGLIPLNIQSGWSLVELNNPITTLGSVLEGYTGDTPVTGDHLEYIITSTLDAGVGLVINPTGEWVVTQASEGDWVTDITVNRRVVQVDGTIGDAGVITLSAQSGVIITLDDVTSSASGDVNLVASLNRTLQNVAPSITGNTLIDGSLDSTLGNVIPITSGAIRVVGVLNSSLEDVVLFSSQINAAVFTGAVEDVESSISGEVYLNGSLNRTLERVNISATTELIVNSSLSKILDNTSVTSSATVTVEGSLSETLDDTIIFTGAVVVGSSTIQLQDVEVSINAESLTIANLDEVIDQVIQASSGNVLLDGTINEVLDNIQISTDGEITLSGDLLGTVEDIRIATSSVPEIVTVITYLVYLFDSYTRG